MSPTLLHICSQEQQRIFPIEFSQRERLHKIVTDLPTAGDDGSTCAQQTAQVSYQSSRVFSSFQVIHQDQVAMLPQQTGEMQALLFLLQRRQFPAPELASKSIQ